MSSSVSLNTVLPMNVLSPWNVLFVPSIAKPNSIFSINRLIEAPEPGFAFSGSSDPSTLNIVYIAVCSATPILVVSTENTRYTPAILGLGRPLPGT